MSSVLILIRLGATRRMERLLDEALDGLAVLTVYGAGLKTFPLSGRRLIFAVGMDAFGPDPSFYETVRWLRQNRTALAGCVAGLVVDGGGELYTKQAAQTLVMAANLAGCAFPGKPLVEGTGSLYNQHILAEKLGLTWEETYRRRVRELALRVSGFCFPVFKQPRLLMLHASDRARSNTVWMGREILRMLSPSVCTREISLQNGTIVDCRGCSYTACLHYAKNDTCFYGGAIPEQILPAIRECDAMLFLCPNYNDAVSANLMALFNRMTSLLMQHDLYEKYLFGIVVSGYSGGDLVAQQLLGAMCFNKTAILPPGFCLLQTAHDPGSACRMAGIEERIRQFTARIERTLLGRPKGGGEEIEPDDRSGSGGDHAIYKNARSGK